VTKKSHGRYFALKSEVTKSPLSESKCRLIQSLFKEAEMIKFYKSHEPENRHDVSDVLIQVPNDSSLADVLENFELFLLACSFVFQGHVTIIDDEEEE